MNQVEMAPYWYALCILLRGVSVKPRETSKIAYWEAMFSPGADVMAVLQSELCDLYSDPLQEMPSTVIAFIAEIGRLCDTPLSGAQLDGFAARATACLREVCSHLDVLA